MKLIEWTQHYIKFKDSMKRQIVEIKVEDNLLLVTEKSLSKTYYIGDRIEEVIEKVNSGKEFLVVLNTKDNIDYVIKNWKDLISKKELTIIFSNPTTNECWLLHPATHHSISGDENIKEGLTSLYQSITAV